MKTLIIKILLLSIWTISTASAGDSLLDNSQILWSKLINGSLSEIGPLDPLRIPLVKVDQSQGDIRYRMVLNDVEVTGLNESTIESIQIGRGRVKSNLSEYEAGYVSYSDSGKVDAIRYRFHTVVKEPTESESSDSEELKVTPLKGSQSEGQRDFDRFRGRSRNDDLRSREFSRIRIYADESKAPIQGRPSYPSQRYNQNYQNQNGYYTNGQGQAVYYQNPRFGNLKAAPEGYEQAQNQRYQNADYRQQDQDQQSRYTDDTRYYQRFSASPNQKDYNEAYRQQFGRPADRRPEQDNQYNQYDQYNQNDQYNQRFGVKTSKANPSRDTNQYKRPEETNAEDCAKGTKSGCRRRRPQNGQRFNAGFDDRHKENFEAESTNFEGRTRFSDVEGGKARVRYGDHDGVYVRLPAEYRRSESKEQTSERLEEQPGYIDIIYVDKDEQGNNNRMRHFGNLRIDSTRDATVYSFEDAIRDLEGHRRFIIHNFTEGESLLKKNDKARLVEETRRIEDLIRYAKDHQKKEGYFEEGMEIIYHYGKNGNSNSSAIENRRSKRAHEEEDDDDDIMHVIVKIRVPLMRVQAGYVLMGNVDDQVLRGSGRLDGNFTEVVGDFTIELKRSRDNSMVVRAARARLEAADKNVELEGMDDKGPVEGILTQGLVAAEAVAAMLADDLTSKALSDKTSDSIIYKLYKDLPE